MFAVGYVCGALCADGGIYLDARHGNYQIQLETPEREFAEKLRAYLSSCVEKEVKIYETKRKQYKGLPYKTFIVPLYRKRLVTDFANKWGVVTGSYSWKLPEIAFVNREFRTGFLRGFFDGEATIRIRFRSKPWREKRRNVRVTSANKRGLEQLKELLEKEGIKSIIYPADRYWCLDIEGRRRLATFQEKVGFSLQKKKQKLENAIN